MSEQALIRLHQRLDATLSELSTLSQRVARIETYESRVGDNSAVISRQADKLSAHEQKILQLEAAIQDLKKTSSLAPKSKALEYAEKGGLVVVIGAVFEALRHLVMLVKH